MQHRLSHIKSATLISWLQKGELSRLIRLAGCCEMVSCRRNSTLFSAYERGNNIYLIKKGRVKLTRSSAVGREVILDILGPGEAFGGLLMADEEIYSHSAVAIENLQVFIITRPAFEKLLKDHPETALHTLTLASMRLRELEMRLEDLIFQPLANRLVLALLWQARRHGVQDEDGCIALQLTQSDLAHLIGASRESVADRLTQFKRAGLLRTSYRRVQLTDLKGLMQTLSTDSNFEYPELIPLTGAKKYFTLSG